MLRRLIIDYRCFLLIHCFHSLIEHARGGVALRRLIIQLLIMQLKLLANLCIDLILYLCGLDHDLHIVLKL